MDIFSLVEGQMVRLECFGGPLDGHFFEVDSIPKQIQVVGDCKYVSRRFYAVYAYQSKRKAFQFVKTYLQPQQVAVQEDVTAVKWLTLESENRSFYVWTPVRTLQKGE